MASRKWCENFFKIILSHFYTFCALSFHNQATQRPVICPQVNFRKSPRGFRRYLSHRLTFGSDITAPSTIPIFHWNQAKSENTDFFLSQPKSPETSKMVLISISNDKNANWTKFWVKALGKWPISIFQCWNPWFAEHLFWFCSYASQSGPIFNFLTDSGRSGPKFL